MSCCGQKREALVASSPTEENTAATVSVAGDVWFVYTGQTALTVKGPVTRNHYRFSAPGDEQPIDARDAAGIMAVPHLQRLSKMQAAK